MNAQYELYPGAHHPHLCRCDVEGVAMTTTAEAIVEVLEAAGIERVFGYPGGRVIEVFEVLADSDIEVVRPRDERQAAVMAEAHGRLTGEPGILMGQGPWVGSLGAMGLMEARLGSSPLVAITEASERGEFAPLAPYQAARGDYGGIDIPQVLDGMTKETWEPRRPLETITALELALKHAVAGRPGPTAVILDGEAVSAEVPADAHPPRWAPAARSAVDHATPRPGAIDEASEQLTTADRPVIIAGNGVHQASGYDELTRAAEAYGAAVVTSYLGKSTIAEDHPLAGGVIGSYGHEAANQLVADADCLLLVGTRLNPMDANWQAPGFIDPDRQVICHLDIDARNAGWTYPAAVSLVGDAALGLAALAGAAPDDVDDTWSTKAASAARTDAFDDPHRGDDTSPIRPERAIAELEAAAPSDAVVLADSGNNRFWLMQHYQTRAVGTYYGSGGVAGMGWSPPAAVSIELAGHDAISVAGDGGFTMTMTAIETALEYGVAPTFVVLDDAGLGMVREIDPAIPGVDFPRTDLADVARSLGADAQRVSDPDALASAYAQALDGDRPTAVVVDIDPDVDAGEHLQSSFYRSVGGLHE